MTLFLRILILLLLAVGCATTVRAEDAPATSDAAEKTAMEEGKKQAEIDFAKDVHRKEVYGLRRSKSDAQLFLERHYGITYNATAGCIVDSEITGHAKGYNERMRELLTEKHGKDVFEEADTIATTDTDLDRLPDYWEQEHFGNLDQSHTDDPDEDGLDNRQEYLLGSNPLKPAVKDTENKLGLKVLTPMH